MTGERILIVDDDPDTPDFCRRVLQEKGYQVSAVLTRREAIEVAHQGDFQLVLMDIDMPGLDGLLGYATLLEEQVSDESRKHTQAIIHSALHLKKLVADMLNLRYLETGEMKLELEELHPLEIGRAVVGELGFLAEQKGQRLVVEVPGDLPTVRADRQKLELVLSNLVSNAIKFTPDGGAIRIEASMANDLLTVAVKDSGIGIGNEEHERIFDRFYQVEDSLTRQHDGLGLGLSIARGLVELHQGHLWVESSEWQGSTFYFTVSRRL